MEGLKIILHCVGEFHEYLCLTTHYILAPATHDSPHETREVNLMHLRRNIQVKHYALNDKGAPVSVTPSSQLLEGVKSHLLKQYLCMPCMCFSMML